MRFQTSQQMKLGQQMKLAPRMIQSMEVLQMPLAELEERIAQELESNPTLELVDGAPAGEGAGDDASGIDGAGEGFDGRAEAGAGAEDGEGRALDVGNDRDDFDRLDDFEEANPLAAANSFDDEPTPRDESREPTDWRDRLLHSSGGDGEAKMEAMASAPARDVSLGEQLLRQWRVVEVDERLRPLGEVLIGFLDEDGYLRTPLAEVREKAARPATLAPGEAWPASPGDLALALQALQLFLEPAGVAARDARECLLLQLDAQLDVVLGVEASPRVSRAGGGGDGGLDGGVDREGVAALADAESLRIARRLVDEHLDDLMSNRLPRIAQRSGLALDEIRRGIETLRRLSLSPARRLVTDRHEPIIPDATVEFDEDNDRYVAYLNDPRLSQVRINREYALLSKDRNLPKRDRDFLKTNLSNAQWLLDAVEQRRATLLRVIGAVLEEQREWFDYGPGAMKPLPMTLVAERLGVHVATVSRAVADKHLMTPRGVVPLRQFFTGGLSTESGEEVSADAVQAALRELIDGEDKASPLSDEALVKLLNEKGFEIARRTVAKYRGLMNIPTARMRRQFS